MAERHLLLRELEELAQRNSERIAVVADGCSLTYAQLWNAASRIALFLSKQGIRAGDRVGLLGLRTSHDFVHLLAIWLAGAAYVPLNHKFPSSRNRAILEAAGARGLLADAHSAAMAGEVTDAEPSLVGGSDSAYHAIGVNGEEPSPGLAYILFTSGSTGAPKGVPITFDNLAAYLSNLQQLYPLRPQDRMAQLADLSFDASIHEIAWCWSTGGTLCVVPASGALMWPRYAQEHRVTVMLVVPSAIVLAARARLLAPDALPDLRLVFMGAEALTRDVVQAIHAAAPAARLVNLWGPTESTVAFTHFPIDTTRPLPELIPIGHPLPGQTVEIWDEEGRAVAPGERGELVQSGSQVTRGYWRNPPADAQRFVERAGRRWFRSGDLATWDEEGGLQYLGRLDRQVKIRGWRVELLECESAIRVASGCDQVAVLPVVREGHTLADSLACFLAGRAIDIDALRAGLRERLPAYMVPQRFEVLDALPLGPTGKTDYIALAQRLRG